VCDKISVVTGEQLSVIFGGIQALVALLVFFGVDARILKGIGIRTFAGITKREKFLFLLIAGSLVLSGYAVYRSFDRPVDEDPTDINPIVVEWGVMEDARRIRVAVDGRRLISLSPRYKVAAVCYLYTGLVDVLDFDELQKSVAYDIRNERMNIGISLNDEFTKKIKEGMTGTIYLILLVPAQIRTDQFATLRQAYALGIKKIQAVRGPP
jgi:hypothetical protein